MKPIHPYRRVLQDMVRGQEARELYDSFESKFYIRDYEFNGAVLAIIVAVFAVLYGMAVAPNHPILSFLAMLGAGQLTRWVHDISLEAKFNESKQRFRALHPVEANLIWKE